MMQDSRGMLWFSTDHGLIRFNGYQFSRPVDTSAAASGPSFKIVEDSRGRIWFQRLDATLWIVENDMVRAWEHNGILDLYRGKIGLSEGFAVGRDGTVWLELTKIGFLVVAPNGTHRIAPQLKRSAHIFSTVDEENVISVQTEWWNAVTEEQFRRKGLEAVTEERFRRKGLSIEIFRIQDEKNISLGRFPANNVLKEHSLGFRAWRLRNGDFILSYLQNFYLVRDNRLRWHGQKDVFAGEMVENGDGSILLTSFSGKHRGLLRFRSLEHFLRDHFENILPGQLATKVLRDREGGWWACTRNAGIFYCKNPGLDIFDTAAGLPAEDVPTLSTDGRERVFAGLSSLDICVFHRDASRPMPLPRPPMLGSDFNLLRYDTLTGRLWCSSPLCFWENDRWVSIKFKDGKGVYAKKITPDPGTTHWWASTSHGFFSIDLQSAMATRTTPAPQGNERTFSVTPDAEGNLWVATQHGLRLWRNDRYEQPAFHHPALRFQALNVELLPATAGGGMVISLRGGGLLIRDKNGQCTQLTTRDGLTSDVLSDFDITPEGRIYACSNAGLNILSLQANGSWRIETLTMKHGLPSSQVNDVTLLGGELWVATDKGIARFREIPKPVPMPAPVLEKFTVNNRDTVFNPNLRLAHDQNNITLRFFALHFRSGGDIPYRYRLLGADTAFVYTHTREVNFANLSPDRYTFEVQAQNEDGQWSEPARWAFAILPPWWTTGWFRSLVGATLVVALYLFYRNRLQAIRREAAEREKVRELETAALRAQMNPHFIFNCLQAIQSFIAQNDRDSAASYLARFAKLVRLALHSSVDGVHTLAEEMAMLENYLYLEQLRFKGKFEFAVRAETGIDTQEISLPPLLVQPFVENAIIHGLQGRQSGGHVEVVFSLKNESLEALVIDNGQGFSKNEREDRGNNLHKSVGMMLTQKRLSLLASNTGKGEAGFFKETVFHENGAVEGARVRILIPVLRQESRRSENEVDD